MKTSNRSCSPHSSIPGIVILLLLLSLLPTGAPAALAASDRFIAPGGTDSGNCTDSAAPCATFTYALTQAADGDTINVAKGTYTEAGITINKNVTLEGPDDTTDRPIVQAAATTDAATNRVFYITADASVKLCNLTIRHGNTTALTDAFGGGGIRNEGTLELNNVLLYANRSGRYGGGIASYGSDTQKATLVVRDSQISENSSISSLPDEHLSGGGIDSNYSTMLIKDSRILSNTIRSASHAHGGGIYHSIGDLTITNGWINGNSITTTSSDVQNTIVSGGGLAVSFTSTLKLEYTEVDGNQVLGGNASGGGIHVGSGVTGTIRDSDITQNQAPGGTGSQSSGGGIIMFASTADTSLTVINSRIAENVLTSSSSVGGAGISMGVDTERTIRLTVIGSTIEKNVTAGQDVNSGFGGGIRSGYITGATNARTILEIDRSTIRENRATNGGGIASGANTPGITSVLTITNSLIASNVVSTTAKAEQVGNGGGIFHTSGPMTLKNSTVSGNQALGGADLTDQGNGLGGGIALPSVPLTTLTSAAIINTSIVSNTAAVAGGGVTTVGIDVPIPATGTETSLQNTLLTGNTAVGVPQAASCFTQGATATSTSLGNNLGPADAAINIPGMLVTCGLAAGEVQDPAPTVNALADNGGPTLTHALPAGSPAINAGAVISDLTSDQRGAPRDSQPDIGAYEVTSANYDLSLSVSAPATKVGGDKEFTYTLVLSNTGPAPTKAISLTSTLPEWSSYTDWEGSGWDCDQEKQLVVCEHDGLGVGSAEPLTLIIETPFNGGMITLGGQIVLPLDNDTNQANNSASMQVEVDAPRFIFLPLIAK